jgi:hypothetical protein
MLGNLKLDLAWLFPLGLDCFLPERRATRVSPLSASHTE